MSKHRHFTALSQLRQKINGFRKITLVLLPLLLLFSMLPILLVFANNDDKGDESMASQEATFGDEESMIGENNESTLSDEAPSSQAPLTVFDESPAVGSFETPADADNSASTEVIYDEALVPLGTGEAVTPLDGNSFTITFISNGVEWTTSTVIGGNRCTDPGSPPNVLTYWPVGAVSFRGWSTSSTNLEPFDFNSNINADTNLYASFSNKYLVKYKNGYGNVVWTEEYLANQYVMSLDSIAPSIVLTPPGENQRFAYWYVEADYNNTPPPARFTIGSPCTRDMTLVPFYTNQWFVFFISDGTQVPHQMVNHEAFAQVPATPTRMGYSFSHWSTTPGGSAFNFNAPGSKITDNLTLYAVWTPQTVNYTIVYWIEKPNFAGTPVPGNKDHYIYTYSETATGIAGTQTNVTGVSDAAKTSSTEMTYSTFQRADNRPIQGNGATVVNVYSRRNVFTIIFDLNNDEPTTSMQFLGSTYYGNSSSYTVSVKYEQDISAIWPCEGTATFNRPGDTENYVFTGWNVFYDDINSSGINSYVTWATKRLIINPDMLPKNPSSVGYVAYASWSTEATQKNATYYIEALPGQAGARVQFSSAGVTKDYIESTAFSQTFFIFGDLNAKSIAGVTYVGGNSGAAETTDYTFYYDRNIYTLSFNTMGGDPITTRHNVKYEQSLAAFEPSTPTRITDGISYTFKGWYLEPDYHTEFDFDNAIMPASNLTLFAKWQSSQYTVYFYDSLTRDNQNPATVTVGHNEYLNVDDTPYRTGQIVQGKGTFDGWFFYIGDTGYLTRFSYDTPITGDQHLHAVWKVDGFSVTYNIAPGTGTTPLDNDNYYIGKEVRVATGNGIVPPTGMLFLGWLETNTAEFYYPGSLVSLYGNAMFVAQYGNAQDYVQVIYHSNYPGNLKANETITWNVPKNSQFVLATNRLFEYPGSQILSWSLGSNTGPTFVTGPVGRYTVGEATVHFFARWTDIPYTVTYEPGTTDAVANMPVDNATYIMGNSVAVKPQIPVRFGYDFAGWATSFDTATYAAGSSFVMPGENAVLTARWSQSRYTVVYAPGDQGTWTASSETTSDLEYGTATPGFNHDIAVDHVPGYAFTAWAPTVSSTVTGTITYTAQWAIDENQRYTINYVAGAGGQVSLASENHQLLFVGANTGSTAQPNPGFVFVNWTNVNNEEVSTDATFVPTVRSDATYTANFEAVPYSVEYEPANGMARLGRATQYVDDVFTIIETVPTRTGYEFVGWLYDGHTYLAGDTFTMPANDVLFTAGYTARSGIVVTFDAQGGTAPDPASKTVTYDSAYGTLATTSREGYTFLGWFTAASEGTQVTASTIVQTEADHTLYAHWQPKPDAPSGARPVTGDSIAIYFIPVILALAGGWMVRQRSPKRGQKQTVKAKNR